MLQRPDYSGQTDIFNPHTFGEPVHLIGAGGIGGTLALPLMKLGIQQLHIWDADRVEPHNIPSQMIYRMSDIGTHKVVAAAEFAVRQELECTVIPHAEMVTETTELEGVVISGVDSMASRMQIWKAILSNAALIPMYMDGRLGGEQLTLLTLDPSDLSMSEGYEEFWLFPDSQAAELPCAARSVIHPSVVLAGLMITQLTRFSRGEQMKKTHITAQLAELGFFEGNVS